MLGRTPSKCARLLNMEQFVEFPKLGIELTFKNSFTIGTFTISYYGIIIAMGLLLGMLYALRNFKKVGVDADKAIDAIIGGIIGGLVGARLYYVILTYENYKISFESMSEFWRTFSNIFKTWEGGMAIYGGLIGSLIIGLLIARWRKIKIRPLLDIIGIGFLIGQGIGRWGNFFNVEAFGSNTNLPWGMTGPAVTSYLQSNMEEFSKLGVTVDPSMPVHPCFLYESIWCLIGAVLLHLYLKHRKFDGEVFLMYLGYYGIGRFFIEGLRTDSLTIGSLRVSQLLAALFVIGSVITIAIVRSNIKGSNDENYMKLFVTTPEGIAIANGVPFVVETPEGDEILEDETATDIIDETSSEETNEASGAEDLPTDEVKKEEHDGSDN